MRRIFDLTAQGYGRKRVVQILNEEGAVSPRAQRGRPQAWCPSSVHEAASRAVPRRHRVEPLAEADRWGRHRQHARDASEWMRVEAPDLRIVDESVWTAVHDRMPRGRAVYLDRTGGRAHGRPLTGTVSPYLLTGFVSCGCCAGSPIVRSQPHRCRREPRLAWYYYMTRGTRVCANQYEAPLAALDALVLDAIEQDMLAADVGEPAILRAVDLHLRGQMDVEQRARDVSKELAILDREMASGTKTDPDDAGNAIAAPAHSSGRAWTIGGDTAQAFRRLSGVAAAERGGGAACPRAPTHRSRHGRTAIRLAAIGADLRRLHPGEPSRNFRGNLRSYRCGVPSRGGTVCLAVRPRSDSGLGRARSAAESWRLFGETARALSTVTPCRHSNFADAGSALAPC